MEELTKNFLVGGVNNIFFLAIRDTPSCQVAIVHPNPPGSNSGKYRGVEILSGREGCKSLVGFEISLMAFEFQS